MRFRNLTIESWKQFQNINIDFHPDLTVLTGSNGSGKTTILNLLAKHFGWEVNELATPSRNTSGVFKFFARLFSAEGLNTSTKIGSITYSNGNVSTLYIPDSNHNQAQYTVDIRPMQQIKGLNVPSHRPVFYYQPVTHISTQKRTREQAYQLTNASIYQKLYSEFAGKTPNYFIKETLLSWAIGGSGNEFIQADEELRENFKGFEHVLRNILPRSLGFTSISIRNYEIVLVTATGEFMLDAVSGGISAIIDLAWAIFSYSSNRSESITVLVDEIENHLHASMQREILPSLISAFPGVQFIISTHSPLIIGSVKDSNVYALRYNIDNRIYNEKLDLINKAKNANEILNEVLGVPFSMPIWVEESLNRIVDKYANTGIRPSLFQEMRKELKELGLENLMPDVMDKTIEKLDDKN